MKTKIENRDWDDKHDNRPSTDQTARWSMFFDGRVFYNSEIGVVFGRK